MTQAQTVELDGTDVILHWDDGRSAKFNRFWLRDNCPSEGERASLFRTFSLADMPRDLEVVHAELLLADASNGQRLTILFSDGMNEAFDVEALRAHAERPHPNHWQGSHWDRRSTMAEFKFNDLGFGQYAHKMLLDCLARSGAVMVSGVPGERSGTEELAGLLGRIRDTDFGRIFDIVVESDPFTPSQSSAPLPPHTDDPYRYNPSGASILHCVSPSEGDGGASTIVDGLAAAQALKSQDPFSFELLSNVPVAFAHHRADAVKQGEDVHLRAEAPIIAVDRNGRISGIRFHERAMAPLGLDDEVMDSFYQALISFTEQLQEPAFTWTHRLRAGDAILYDNQRVLHGRTAIDGSDQGRHIRLCTIDRDQFHSRLRRLHEIHEEGGETFSLPAGNLSR